MICYSSAISACEKAKQWMQALALLCECQEISLEAILCAVLKKIARKISYNLLGRMSFPSQKFFFWGGAIFGGGWV